MVAYIPLNEPIPIKDQKWPEGTLPLVTTRTMTFNHKAFIVQCIEGIINQKTTFPVQVLIHDDASNDGTIELIKQYEKENPRLIKSIIQPVNTFKLSNRYELRKPFFNLIQGKYVATCEGDDFWSDENKLEKQVQYLESNNACIAVSNYTYILNEKGELHKEPPPKNHRIYFRDILLGRKGQTRTVALISRSKALDIESFSNLGQFKNGDRKLKLVLIKNGGYIQVLPFYGAVYRHHVGGIWALASREKKRGDVQRDYIETHRNFSISLGLKCRYVVYHLMKTIKGDLRYGRFKFIWQTITALFILPQKVVGVEK
jgi:glycosyltransferase involved in cell wall biosynthesis